MSNSDLINTIETEDGMSVFKARFFISNYPKHAKIKQYYQGLDTDDKSFVEATKIILGDDAEYPDYDHKEVRWLIAQATKKIHAMLR